MIIRGYSDYYGDSIWDWAQEQLDSVEATKKAAIAKAGEQAKTGATTETAKFWTGVAWAGAAALVAVLVFKKKR